MADIRAVRWDRDKQVIVLVDQTLLPGTEADFICQTTDQLIDAIMRLVVRGAPALGAVGALGVALAMVQAEREGWDQAELQRHVDAVRDARPTAVNLAWGVDQVRPLMERGFDAVLAGAHRVIEEDEAANRALSRLGADWIEAHVERRPIRVLTHCNTGALATSAWGTAFGIIHELHTRGLVEMVYADETRPLLQGARLTAYELQHDGIPYVVQADGAAASTIMRGLVDFAVIGADRIARNGDTANKIGSLGVAIACREAGIPFVVAAPSSTVDLSTLTGDDIHVELRSGDEVTVLNGIRLAPAEAVGFNPAFDVTPSRYISAIVSECGVVEPDGTSSVAALVAGE